MSAIPPPDPECLPIAIQAAESGTANHWPTVAGHLLNGYRYEEEEARKLRVLLLNSMMRWAARECRCNPDRRGTYCHRCASIVEAEEALGMTCPTPDSYGP